MSRQRQCEAGIEHDQVKQEQEEKREEEETSKAGNEEKEGHRDEGDWMTARRRKHDTPGVKRVLERMKVAEARRAALSDEQLEEINMERRARRRSRRQPQQQRHESAAEHRSKKEDDKGDGKAIVYTGCDPCDIHGDPRQEVCNETASVEQEIASNGIQMLEPEQDARLRSAQTEEFEQVEEPHETQTRDDEQNIASQAPEQKAELHCTQSRVVEQLNKSLESKTPNVKQNNVLQSTDNSEIVQNPDLHEAHIREVEQTGDPQKIEIEQTNGPPKTSTPSIEQDLTSQDITITMMNQDQSSQNLSTANAKPHDPRPSDVEHVNAQPQTKTPVLEHDIQAQGISATAAITHDTSPQNVNPDDNLHNPASHDAPTRKTTHPEKPPLDDNQTPDTEQDIPSQSQRTNAHHVKQETSCPCQR